MYRQSPLNLLKHATSGRDKELQEILGVLKQIHDGGPSRVVAITGPSGVGKVCK